MVHSLNKITARMLKLCGLSGHVNKSPRNLIPLKYIRNNSPCDYDSDDCDEWLRFVGNTTLSRKRM